MKDLIAIDLLLPTTTLHFFGPRPASSSSSSSRHTHTTHPKRHKLRGKLRIVTSKPIKLRQVQIKFRGFTHLSWRERSRNFSAPPGSAAALGASLGLMNERMEAWKILRKSKQILLEDATLPAGVTDLGFEMSIPGHLPHSYLSEFLEIGYAIVAKMTPQGKFGKPVRVERKIDIVKTLMPKDVSCGYLSGYVVPRVRMTGRRESMGIRWDFRVPKFVCLDDERGVEFVGAFFKTKRRGRLNEDGEEEGEEEPKIERILVDVIQEELYRLCPTDTPDQSSTNDLATFLFPTNNPPKRHLVTPQTHPSTYLHPPWSCPIQFSFPFLPPPSSPTTPTSTKFTARTGLLTHTGPLTHTLDSPFLLVSHYVRLRVDFSDPYKNPPLCLGLPLNVTRRIRKEEVVAAGGVDPEGLPSYSSVVRDGERLPDYTVDGEDDDENGIGWSEEEDEVSSSTPTLPQMDTASQEFIVSEELDRMRLDDASTSEHAEHTRQLVQLLNHTTSDSEETDPMVSGIAASLASAEGDDPAGSSRRSRPSTEEIVRRLPPQTTLSPQPSTHRRKRDPEVSVPERSMSDFFEIYRPASKWPFSVTTSQPGSASRTQQPRPAVSRSRSTGALVHGRVAGVMNVGREVGTVSQSGNRARAGSNTLTAASHHTAPNAVSLLQSLATA